MPEADYPVSEILEIAGDLVRIPSQGGIDSPLAVLNFLKEWFEKNGLPGDFIRDADGVPVAFLALYGDENGPLYCLNTCADTAPAGSRELWSTDPFGGEIKEGRLWGRGAGDSKLGAAIFSVLFRDLVRSGKKLKGRLGVLFDGDEHTGGFGGVKEFVRQYPETAGIMIGYPGNTEVVCGARGFFRPQFKFLGRSTHTGLPDGGGINAVSAAADFIKVEG